MCMRNVSLVSLVLIAGYALAEDGPKLGEAVSASDLAIADFAVLPNGDGLPEGSGNALDGAAVYAENCLACHGERGTEGLNDRLVGGSGSLTSSAPIKTVGSFWPYATTLFDYVRRAMPFQSPGSLSNDEIYAVTAYILFLNDIVDEQAEMNAKSLPRVHMPNRDNVVWQYHPE
jgi:cytochrome c